MFSICADVGQFNDCEILHQFFGPLIPRIPLVHAVTWYIPQSGNCDTSLTAVGAPQGVSLERLVLQGAVRVTWSPPTDLCGLTNPQYTGRDFTVVTTAYRGFADYDVRDMTVQCVS